MLKYQKFMKTSGLFLNMAKKVFLASFSFVFFFDFSVSFFLFCFLFCFWGA